MIESEQSRQVNIFDMDGTLYEFVGPQNTFAGSELEKRVNNNALNFIIQNEQCSDEQAQQILEIGLQDSIGLSNYLSQRYQISRKEYFDVVWNIDPDRIISNFDSARKMLRQIAATTTKCILVTGAAKVWQRNVLKYLGIEDIFEEIYTGEDFDSKKEIFSRLSQRYSPANITSIGDQLITDIEPAKQLGLRTLLITNPNQINKLMEQ